MARRLTTTHKEPSLQANHLATGKGDAKNCLTVTHPTAMMQIHHRRPTRMLLAPWNTGHPTTRGGVGGRGNGYTSTRSGHHTPGADTQLQICHYVVLADETPRGRTGILVPESATTCWEQAVRARSSHHHAAPTAKSLSASRRKRRPTPARPTTTRGVDEGSATAFLFAPWVVPVVNSSGSTTAIAGMSSRWRRLGFGHRPCGSRERHGGFVLLSR
jgi:hypothetical protein